ncbi:MAG: diaminopimelate decarboxylase [bacterium]
MNLPLTGKVNQKGHLEIGGCDAVDLAKKFGTPLYVLDEKDVRENCRAYKKLFKSKYPNSDVIYASKALSAIGLLKIISDEELGVDVSSGGELYAAIEAGVSPKKIYFHGNNKSEREIEEGLFASVGKFVIDNLEELKVLDELTVKTGRKTQALIRVNPGVEAHTHEAVKTGQTDSKFGMAKSGVLEAVKSMSAMRHVRYAGLHAHIGSQIFDAEGYLAEIDVLAELAAQIHEKLKIETKELNIGGGVGIAYVDPDDPMKLESFASAVIKKLKEKIASLKLPIPRLAIEPGRSIVGRAGVTLYTIGHVKDIPGVRKYVVVDGGMSDNPRPMLYGAKYEFAAADNMNAKKSEKVTIAGRFCESGDVMAKDVELPNPERGGLVAVFCTGAYNHSMSSNYNRVPRPAMVIVKDGRAKLIVKRETYEDIARNDIK